MDVIDIIKIKTSTLKYTIKRVERQPTKWEKIYVILICDNNNEILLPTHYNGYRTKDR